MSAMLKGQLVNSLAFERLKAIGREADTLQINATIAAGLMSSSRLAPEVAEAATEYLTRVLASLDALGELAGQLRGEGK